MNLVISSPISIADHFAIPEDKTAWSGFNYKQVFDSQGKAIGKTPARQRASFRSWQQCLIPTSKIGIQLDHTYGLYILALTIPHPALYVGIAANSSKSPEGMLNRIKKHRTKLTGSHVGSSQESFGGVNHTGGFRSYAPPRAKYFAQHQKPDQLGDMQLLVCQYSNNSSGIPDSTQEKHLLENFESCLCSDDGGIRTRIASLLWPSNKQHELLTTNTRGAADFGMLGEKMVFKLWDKTVVSV